MVTRSAVPAFGMPGRPFTHASPSTVLTKSPHLLAAMRARATSSRLGVRSSSTTLLKVRRWGPSSSMLAPVPPPRSTHTPPFGVGMASIMGTRPCRNLWRYTS